MPNYQFSCHVVTHHLSEQSSPGQQIFAFAYTITVRNTGTIAAQLISRHWVIRDANGQTEEVKGLGVVGRQPLLKPGEAFEYSSGTRLRTPSGVMHGSYFCVAEDGERFEVEVPLFVLQAEVDGQPAGRVLH